MQDIFNLNHFSSFTVNGKKRNIEELEGHLNELVQKGITVKTRLNIGDIVKLKGREYTVVIEYVDYEMEGIGKVDYAGKRTDGKEANLLCVFNQNEIDSIVKISNKKEEER